MSIEIPKVALAFGTVAPPQGDIVEVQVHLGCTKEVSSFMVLLQNWDKKYSPNGTYPITVSADGHIDIGRGSNAPTIITCRVERIQYEPSSTANYLRVSGRCWGEKLFRRLVTKGYYNQKGEVIVKDLLDNFVGLSHNRSEAELVEDTDTTYTRLEYEDTPVWEILKYIAESSSKSGAIGFDFRLAPDAKFEFFPRNSKTSSVSLSEKLEVAEYWRDIYKVKNKIRVYGAVGRCEPSDGDAWTESITDWALDFGTSIAAETTSPKVGIKWVKAETAKDIGVHHAKFRRQVLELNPFTYQNLKFYCQVSSLNGLSLRKVYLLAPDSSNYFAASIPSVGEGTGQWQFNDLALGKGNEYHDVLNPSGVWTRVGNACWFSITSVEFDFLWNHGDGANILCGVDGLFFDKGRWRGLAEDSGSQSAYGLRELVETDEELCSDGECGLRASALLDSLKSPAEYVKLRSTVIDYGNSPLLPGDSVHVVLPNENVDADFRILGVDYCVDGGAQTLELSLELGREQLLLADFLYALRSAAGRLSKYKVGR
jgi:hypothetical protein